MACVGAHPRVRPVLGNDKIRFKRVATRVYPYVIQKNQIKIAAWYGRGSRF